MTDSTEMAKGRLGALGVGALAGLAVVCCAAGPLIVGVVAGAGAGGLVGGLGGALLVGTLVAAGVLIARARSRRAVCGSEDRRGPGDRGPTFSGRDGA